MEKMSLPVQCAGRGLNSSQSDEEIPVPPSVQECQKVCLKRKRFERGAEIACHMPGKQSASLSLSLFLALGEEGDRG